VLLIGQTVSHYKILEKLGAGGMGVVYKAEDTKLGRLVALKFLPADLTRDPEAKQRFILEARAASSLQHENICTIHDIDETPDRQLFIVMDYYQGETLKETISKGPLPLDRAVDLAVQTAAGLKEAHDHGIVHRDIKPANILITEKGQVKIMDFGLAKLMGRARLTKSSSTVGTVAYMSPEQARGEEVDQRTDIWSLGVVFYEILTGQLPFKGEYEQSVIYSILNEKPKPLKVLRPELSDEFNRTIDKAIAKIPAKRYSQMKEFVADLKRLQIHLAFTEADNKSSVHHKKYFFYLAGGLLTLILLVFIANIHSIIKTPAVIDSIAVLPFQNLSADPEQEYFSDGMTDALITELSKIRALRVISRTSVMHYKKTDKTLPQIAGELHVKAIVEGSVQRVNDVVRINAQLVRAEPEEHLWAKPFTKNFANIFELESEVAQAIAGEIKITLTPEERKQLSRSGPVNPAAHEAYLKGRFFINKLNKADVKKGISCFEQAIAVDSSYALAYAGLAEGYDNLWSWGGMLEEDAFPIIKSLAMKALSIDPNLAEPYALIADIATAEWDWQVAEENYQRAIGLNQNYATGLAYYGWYLVMMNRPEEALSMLKRAIEIDPLWPFPKSELALAYMFGRQFDSAMTQINEALTIDSTFVVARVFLGDLYWWQGNFEKAIAQYQKAVARGDPYDLLLVSYCYARSGNVIKAREILSEARAKDIKSALYAIAYMGLGEWDHAFKSLDLAYEQHDSTLLVIISVPHGFDSELDRFRAEPRFLAFVKKMGLEKIVSGR